MRLVVLMMTAMLAFGVGTSVAQAQPAKPAQTQAQAKPEAKFTPHLDRVIPFIKGLILFPDTSMQ